MRWLAGKHLIRERTERINVGAPVDRTIARGLLGRHVLGRPQREPSLRHPLPARVAYRKRDPEVGDHRLPRLHQDVLGLEIPMDHAVLVRIRQRAGDRRCNPHGVGHGELLLAIEPRAQRLPLHERHHIKELPAGLAAVEQRQQVRVLQVRRDLDLGQEPLDTKHGAEFRLEHLERNATVVTEVAREVDGRHAALADLTVDGIASGERRRELVESCDRSA